MSMQSEGKDAKGRNYDQATKDGSGSAASMGAGGTGNPATTAGNTQFGDAGGEQSARTDDLLSDGSGQDQGGEGFVGEEAGELQTGLSGIGSLSTGNAGSRQKSDE